MATAQQDTGVTIKELLESGAHFGHQTRRWNPKMKRFIFEERNGIYIIDLAKTLQQIRSAAQVVREMVAKRKSILFVGTKKQAKVVVKESAEECGEFYVCERWLGGTLTNLQTIRQSVKTLERIEKRIAAGGEGLTKKEISVWGKERVKLDRNLAGIRSMRKPPGLLIVVDPSKEHIAVAEANVLGIPVMALVDTNCDPDPIDYVIACNDDALKSIKVILAALTQAIIDQKNDMNVPVAKGDSTTPPTEGDDEEEGDEDRGVGQVMMKEITPDMIKELRERTGVGMGKCKEALVLSEGDMEKAIDHLRKAGMAAGVKKEGRETKEGLILTGEDKHTLVIAEANAETDFVAQNDRFKHFLHDVVKQALEVKPKSLDDLIQQPYYKDRSITIDQYRNLVIQALGENIQLRRVEVIHRHPNSSYGIYSHMGGKLVVVVEIEGASDQDGIAKEIAMHVAAENPDYLKPEEIPAHALAREEEIARAAVQGKPDNIVDKIVAGKLKAFTDQACLIHQKYVKDNSVTVQQYLDICAKKLGKPLSIRCFWRWKVGQ